MKDFHIIKKNQNYYDVDEDSYIISNNNYYQSNQRNQIVVNNNSYKEENNNGLIVKYENQIILLNNQLINIFNQLIHGMRKNQGNYIDTSKQYKPYYFELRNKGAFWCKEGYVKAYDRYGNCKIIAECDCETSFNCYSYIYGNEYI